MHSLSKKIYKVISLLSSQSCAITISWNFIYYLPFIDDFSLVLFLYFIVNLHLYLIVFFHYFHDVTLDSLTIQCNIMKLFVSSSCSFVTASHDKRINTYPSYGSKSNLILHLLKPGFTCCICVLFDKRVIIFVIL